MEQESGRMRLARAYEEFGPLVFRRARRLLGSQEDAEEALQEVFIKVARNFETFESKERPLEWLYRVTTNHCLNVLRSGNRRRELFTEHYRPRTHLEWVPEDGLLLEQLLQGCEEREAAAAIMAYCDGMSHREIAPVLGVSKRTVGNLLERVRERAEKLSRGKEGGSP